MRAQDATPTQGFYNATTNKLESVSFPDGHGDRFTYYTSGPSVGKLESLFQDPVGGPGALSRQWTFAWNGDELTSITLPDGSAYQFAYNATRPGYLDRVELVAAGQTRVIAAFSTWPGPTGWRRAGAAPSARPAASTGECSPTPTRRSRRRRW